VSGASQPVEPSATPPTQPSAAGRLVRLGVVLPADADAARQLAVLCDRAGIDVVWAPTSAIATAVSGLVSRAALAVLDADGPDRRTVGVSIGRTATEGEARALLDPEFSGDVVGRLEDGQAVVAALAHAGVTDLRCRLPAAPDVADLVAQLTAMVVGSATTHRPGAPRTPDPAPPPWAPRRAG
jgi:hypothetical protein